MFEIDKKEFGSFLAELRKEKGLTQKELAACLLIYQYFSEFRGINPMAVPMPLMFSLFGLIFGIYACFSAKEKLPAYFDENQISAMSDGMFRMNLPGVHFNNSNWKHILG